MAAPEGYSEVGLIGLVNKGTYDAQTEYSKYNFVYYQGSTYLYINSTASTGNTPANDNIYWQYMSRGFEMDSTPTSGSTNAVTSGGIYSAMEDLKDDIEQSSNATGTKATDTNNILGGGTVTNNTNVQALLDSITDKDTTPTSASTNVITSGGVYTALASKQDSLSQAQLDAVNSGVTSTEVTQIGTNTTDIGTINTTIGNTDISEIGNSVTAAISSLNNDLANISNPNLLDNPFFSINQRGQTSYTIESNNKIYTLDRWYIYDSRTIVTVNNDGSIKFETQTGGFKIFAQPLAPSLYQSLLGKNVTATINVSEKLANSRIYFYIDGQLYGLTNLKVGYNKITVTVPNEINDYMQFRVQLADHEATNVYAVIKSVKLELGTVSTLEMDAAPNYTTELLKCQRYYHIYATQSLRPSNMYDCIPQMRDTPTQSTITIGGTTYYANSADL